MGDIESLPFLEAIRQFRREVGPENVLYLHVTLVPFIEAAGELKTKPTQHSVNELRRIGIHPDAVVCRSSDLLSHDIREKIALFADVDARAVFSSPDMSDVYLVPEHLMAEGLDAFVCDGSGSRRPTDLAEWIELDRRIAEQREEVEIALVGKYVEAPRRLPVGARGAQARRRPPRRARSTCAGWTRRTCRTRRPPTSSSRSTGCSSPAGSAPRLGGEDPRLPGRARARDPVPRHLPRHARRGLGVRPPRRRARGRQLDRDGSRDAVSGDRPPARAEGDRGSRRHDAARRAGGRARGGDARREIYDDAVVHERHRHRYEVNNQYRPLLVESGLVVSGTFQEGRLVEIIELPDHPWFVASQFHPEFKSRPTRPAPLFRDFVGAALERARDARASRRNGRLSRRHAGCRRRLRSRPWPSSSISSSTSWRSRARRGRSARSRIRITSDLTRPRARSGRGRRRPTHRLDRGQPVRRAWTTSEGVPIFLCAHLDTVPHDGELEPVVEDGVVRNAGGTILGADNKSALAVMLEATRRCLAERRPHAGVELLFTPKEEVGLLGAAAFDCDRLDARVGYVYDQAAPIGEVILGAPHAQAMEVRFHGRPPTRACTPRRGAPRSPPRQGRIADLRLGRVDEETTANVGKIEGGPPATSSRSGARSLAEARSHNERKLADLVQEMLDAFAFAATLSECEVETELRKKLPRLPLQAGRSRRRARAALLARSGYEPTFGLPAAPLTPTCSTSAASRASTSRTGWSTSTRRPSGSPSPTSRGWSTSRWR